MGRIASPRKVAPDDPHTGKSGGHHQCHVQSGNLQFTTRRDAACARGCHVYAVRRDGAKIWKKSKIENGLERC